MKEGKKHKRREKKRYKVSFTLPDPPSKKELEKEVDAALADLERQFIADGVLIVKNGKLVFIGDGGK